MVWSEITIPIPPPRFLKKMYTKPHIALLNFELLLKAEKDKVKAGERGPWTILMDFLLYVYDANKQSFILDE